VTPKLAIASNRLLVVSKREFLPAGIEPPTFEPQLPSNLVAIQLREPDLTIVALRVPYYERDAARLFSLAWGWLEATAAALKDRPAVILGDLNCGPDARPLVGRDQFLRLTSTGGWQEW
jgi:hypothetical protein